MPRANRPVILLTPLCVLFFIIFGAVDLLAQDTARTNQLIYPIEDREGDHVTDKPANPFLLKDPSQIEKNIEYDPETDRYIITETLDGRNVKPPTYLTFEEYLETQRRESQQNYWKERAESISLIEEKGVVPKLYVTKSKFGDIFGSNTIDIRPSGNIDLTFGGNVQKIDNPTLTENQRRNGGFDFDMKINMNVIGKIGDKVKINLTYNTEATFDFENQIKLMYEGEEDEIIKLIEAGNVNFALPTSLITGSQSLFGLKTKLQFGRLTISSVYSQQKSKAETLTIKEGAQTTEFEIYADQYDENRHFFLSHFFRDNYNDALSTLPNINSLAEITRVEVWITNKTGATENARDIVGFMDLGETARIHNPNITPTGNTSAPDNQANNLYPRIASNPNVRSIDNVVSTLQNQFFLQPVEDFEKTYARKLSPSEFTVNSKLGYISLNQALYADEVLGVAFEYTLNGEVHRVGEFAENVPQDLENPNDSNSIARTKVVFLKLLKSTAAKPDLPIWDLMMKNIYPLGAFQVNPEDFKLQVMYQDPGGGVKRYLPEGSLSDRQLIRLLQLDRLNTQNDPMPDGVFDFIPGITINPNNGRVIFPVLEPFGDYLRQQFVNVGEANLANRYVYDQLYDSTKVIAQQFPQFNRFVLEGTFKSSVTNEIPLGAFNVPPGSVVVTAGGQQLVEGRDYTVDYSLGRVKIINEGILNSGVPINVSYENNALFGFQTKTMFGTRLDYRVNDKLSLGGTLLHLRERPFTEKVNIGEDPIKNMQLGLDFNYNTESEFLTWLVDKLPLYETKEPSSFSLTGEMAHLKPGHQRAIGKEGTVYIDDFEGTSSSYDLRFPANGWYLSSAPQSALDRFGRELFPEADIDSLPYNFNRARLAWYNIDPLFLRDNSATPDHITNDDQSNHYVREIDEQEVFPNRTQTQPINTNILTFDLAFYPNERGPYNFESTENGYLNFSQGVNPDGTLKEPETRWAGIMRSIDNTDFESSNTEFIEFWVLDPFIDNTTSQGGELYINLGNISEDILKDSRKFFENGLPSPDGNENLVDTTVWGVVPRNQPITNAFDNDPDRRQYQDLGLDGLNDDVERGFYDTYLQNLSGFLNPGALQAVQNDPSSDNYHYYRGDDYDNQQLSILERYKRYNNPQGNSPVSEGGQEFSEAATNIPDSEDLNRDFTLNESEGYFQYRIELRPGMNVEDHPYITDIVTANVRLANGNSATVNWYQFKIPIDEYERKVGLISDFKSIRFIRMFLTDFEEPVILRFAKLELVRNQWRRYLFSLLEPGEYIPGDEGSNAEFSVSAVNIEENSEKQPIPYALPPDIDRERNVSSTNIAALQNEQSLRVVVCGLADGDARAVYKTLNLDLRTYKRMQMYIHGESADPLSPLNDGDVRVFIRLGADFTNNYYEYELPLRITPNGNYNPESDADRNLIWPAANQINIPLDSLYKIKLLRNQSPTADPSSPFTVVDGRGNRYTVVGNPDLGLVKTAMLGIRNPAAQAGLGEDDGRDKCAEVWFNEFRLTGLDEKGGWAALARMETKLADLGGLTFSTLMHTRGYGQIEQKVQERFKDDFWQYDLAGNIELGKFIPKKVGLRIPMYAGISQSFSTPEYDPYELDVPLNEKLALMGSERTDYKRQVQARETIKSLNFTNVRIVPERADKKIRFYHPSNLNFTFAYTSTVRSDAFIEADLERKYMAMMGYNFAPEPKYITPFGKAIKSRSKYLALIKDINFNFIPSKLDFSTQFNRQFGETRLRVIGDEIPQDPTYEKYFFWDRTYGIGFNPTRSITFDFTAINNAVIDEPEGRIDNGEKKDSIWNNIFDGGRTTRYQHTASANYNVPLNKIPLLDWTQARAGYSTNYTWTTGALFRDFTTDRIVPNPLGNTIMNSQDIRLNGELNFKNPLEKFIRIFLMINQLKYFYILQMLF